MESVKYLLSEERLPKRWYNIQADLPEPLPAVLHPGTKQPVGPDDLSPLFAMELIGQEVSTDRDIDIPDPVRDLYRQWRPSPLYRARRLEKALDTPAHIYYKYEGVSPVGSHKPNTAVAQAFYNMNEGNRKLTTETGAGQWGSALSMACAQFNMELAVYMVKVSYHQKPYRRGLMETFGASVTPSPSDTTESGRAVLAKHPDSTGSLGIAISEAVEMAVKDDKTKYALGSVLNHVMLHQTIIGEEAMLQFEDAGEAPNILIGCTGGGSNFAGMILPFLGQRFRDGRIGNTPGDRIIAVEPSACPSLTKGPYAYDYGDTAHLTPLVKMYTLGSEFVPPGFHAGGLRYHGMSPIVSHLSKIGAIEATSIDQMETFAAGVEFARVEGILPAPEANHAVAATIREAIRCREEGKSEVIAFNLCGHGHFDLQAYMDYHDGKLEAYEYPEEEIAMALSGLPSV
ncbi:MAG: TrpB-like pyridoxal phosphate-dependent enzyme [Spirochaetia bacterium]